MIKYRACVPGSLIKAKFSWKTAESQFIVNEWVVLAEKIVEGELPKMYTGGLEVLRSQSLIDFGVLVLPDGESDPVVSHRISAGSKHWGARRKQLRNRSSPLELRLWRYYCTVMKTIVWGSGVGL